MVGTSDECDAATASIYQVLSSHLGCFVAIGRHGRETVGQAGTSEKHQWNVHLGKFLKMTVVRRGLCQTGYDTLNMQTNKVVDGVGLILKTLVAIGTDDAITGTAGLRLNAIKDGSIVMCHQIRHDDTNDTGSFLSKALGKGVGAIIEFLGKVLDALLHLLAYLGRTAQGSADGGNADSQLFRQILQRRTMLFFVDHD